MTHLTITLLVWIFALMTAGVGVAVLWALAQEVWLTIKEFRTRR